VPSAIAIRRAVVSDAPALATLAAELFPLGCPETAQADLDAYISTELTPARMAALIADENIVVLLAESGGRMIAYMVVVRSSPQAQLGLAGAVEFRKLYLSPAFHGQGVADALVETALAILNAEGGIPIWLSVFSENARAIAFYRRWGFEIAAEQLFLVGNDPQRDYIMLRR
jgi:ribosomal protein S18 acetylase RimI-like enzyme